jgi:Flp pilus assembly protein TadG
MKTRRRERGATIVETAVTIMLLLTFLFACIEFGRAYNVFQTITNASREGARFSVAPLPGTNTLPTTDDVKAWTEQFLASANIKDVNVDVTQTFNGPEVGGATTVYTQVTVSASHTFLFFPFGKVPLSTEARMRNETN